MSLQNLDTIQKGTSDLCHPCAYHVPRVTLRRADCPQRVHLTCGPRLPVVQTIKSFLQPPNRLPSCGRSGVRSALAKAVLKEVHLVNYLLIVVDEFLGGEVARARAVHLPSLRYVELRPLSRGLDSRLGKFRLLLQRVLQGFPSLHRLN